MIMKNKRLLVEFIPSPEEIDGIYVSEGTEESHNGRIVAVEKGSGYELGQIVVYSKYAGSDVVINNDKYVMILEEDVWLIQEVN